MRQPSAVLYGSIEFSGDVDLRDHDEKHAVFATLYLGGRKVVLSAVQTKELYLEKAHYAIQTAMWRMDDAVYSNGHD